MGKQLYEKLFNGEFSPISPITAIQDIKDIESGDSLYTVLSQNNHIYIKYKGSIFDIRKAVPIDLRRPTLFISYKHPTNNTLITEKYIGLNNDYSDDIWTLNSNWSKIIDEFDIPNLDSIISISEGIIGFNNLTPELQQLLYSERNNTINNFPDNEDISLRFYNNNCKISSLGLKDREYDPYSFSGKGYKILRKNIIPDEVNIDIDIPTYVNFDGILECPVYVINNIIFKDFNNIESYKIFYSTLDKCFLLGVELAINNTVAVYEYYALWDNENNININSKNYNYINPCTGCYSGRLDNVYINNNIKYQIINNKLEPITRGVYFKYKNILTQNDFINKPNTIFVLRYDFDLNNESIVLENNCEIILEGGTIKNGNINLNNAKLIHYIGNITDYFINCNVTGIRGDQS